MFLDKFSKEISVGSKIVYPARPGGQGPLQLIAAAVTTLEHSLGEITVLPEFSNKPLKIRRYDRVAVVA